VNASDETLLPSAGSDFFGELDIGVTCACCAILMAAIAVVDKLTGYDLRLAELYLIPISIVSWVAGRTWGVLASAVAMTIWLVTFRNSHHYASDLLHYWDGALMLATFLVIVMLLARLREKMRNSRARFAAVLEEVDAAAFVADAVHGEVLYGNRRFHATHPGRSWGSLKSLPAREREFRWFDGRPVILRVLNGDA
jgi:K+-sensing histidine kinase KdpD